MDALLKKEWLEALRSGNYNQTEGCLKNDDGFCCLGVLCDVMDDEAWGDKDVNGAYEYRFKNGATDIGVLAYDTNKELGLNIKVVDPFDDSASCRELQSVLMDMNDEHGKSFSEIADYIEKVL